ncbi:MAG: cupin domain-containing protein [Pseudomonadota bacterium]
MSALHKHDDLFRYGPEVHADPVAFGIKQVVLGTDARIVQAKSWFERGAMTEVESKPFTLVSYVLDGFFEVHVDGKSQVLGPSGSFIVPSGAEHIIACLEAGVLLNVFASERTSIDEFKTPHKMAITP